jgi:hypothetical protein
MTWRCGSDHTGLVMSKTKGQTFWYCFGNETKTFWYRSGICLVDNRLFRFGPESALLNQIEMCSFDGADSRTNSDVLVSFLLDVGTFVGTFVERLWNVCSFTVLTLLYRILQHWMNDGIIYVSNYKKSVADPDPGSGAFLTPGSGMVFSGFRISKPYFWELSDIVILWNWPKFLSSALQK